MLLPSKYNIVIKMEGTEEFALLNPLNGSFDLATREEVAQLATAASGGVIDDALAQYLTSRGYLYAGGPEAEQNEVLAKLEAFSISLRESPTQLFLIPTYDCNLTCEYCYQRGLITAGG